jgi:hypothetical protein
VVPVVSSAEVLSLSVVALWSSAVPSAAVPVVSSSVLPLLAVLVLEPEPESEPLLLVEQPAASEPLLPPQPFAVPFAAPTRLRAD